MWMRLRNYLKKYIKALIFLSIVCIVLIIIFISYKYRHYNFDKNILLMNSMFLFRLASYILGSMGALSIVIVVLQYRQSKAEKRRKNVEESMELMKYFLSRINKDFQNISSITSKIAKADLDEVRKYLKNKGYNKSFKIKKNFGKKLILNARIRALKVGTVVESLNEIEYWANYVNEGFKYDLIDESNLYRELHGGVIQFVKYYRPALIKTGLIKYYSSFNELFNRWSK